MCSPGVPSALIFVLFLPLWGSSRGILVMFEAPGPSHVHVWALQTRTFERPGACTSGGGSERRTWRSSPSPTCPVQNMPMASSETNRHENHVIETINGESKDLPWVLVAALSLRFLGSPPLDLVAVRVRTPTPSPTDWCGETDQHSRPLDVQLHLSLSKKPLADCITMPTSSNTFSRV